MVNDKKKRWKVVVIVVGMSALIIAATIATAFFVLNFFTSSGAYKGALKTAQKDERVINELGQPIIPGWYVTGEFNCAGDFCDARFTIPVSGPSGEAKIYVVAEKKIGEWIFEDLVVVTDNGTKINLLQAVADD